VTLESRPRRDRLLEIVDQARAEATDLVGFNYEAFGKLMKARAPNAWATEHWCFQCGRSASFGYRPPWIVTGEVWGCRDHQPPKWT